MISKNKYNVGLTDILYKLFRWNPVSGYLLRITPAMNDNVKKKLEKLRLADFNELSISPFFSLMVCVK